MANYPTDQGNPAGAIPVYFGTAPGGSGKAPSLSKAVVVPASQTNQLIGSAVAGNYLGRIIIVPATTAPGAITMKDGSGGGSITIFTGGVGSILDLSPRELPVPFLWGADASGIFITTGANVTTFVYGNW